MSFACAYIDELYILLLTVSASNIVSDTQLHTRALQALGETEMIESSFLVS